MKRVCSGRFPKNKYMPHFCAYTIDSNAKEMLSSPQMLKNLQTIRNRRMLWSLDVVELNKQISNLTSQSHTLAQLKQSRGLVDRDIFISRSMSWQNSSAQQS